MTTETRKRIRAYKRMLPELRERVIAVALLLVMSVSMLGSASFAWLTISRRPEVTGASTTIAANGNLEIALATGTGKDAPKESKVGDSSAAKDQDITVANTTWGNLINLSDPSYGLDNLILRPAQLNSSTLLTSPLYAAYYTADGRISDLTSDFEYTQWVPPAGNVPGYFGLATSAGVRGISSVKKELTGEYAVIAALNKAADSWNKQANEKYLWITQQKPWMESLSYIMGVFMTDRMNATQGDDSLTNPTIDKAHLGNLIDMYEAFNEAFSLQAKALADTLNLQLFIKHNGKTDQYTEYTEQSLLQESQTTLKAKGLHITEFDQFKKEYNLMVSDWQVLKEIDGSGTVKWQDNLNAAKDRSMKAVINSLVNLNTCTLEVIGEPVTKVQISGVGASNALTYNEESCYAVITNGVLKNFERRGGARMTVGREYNNGKGLKLKATAKRGITMDGTIYAIISTDAQGSLFDSDLQASMDTSGVEFEGNIQAQDTYGLAIDFWVRTNANASYLILEGDVRLSDPRNVDVKGTDAKGDEVQLYTLTRIYTNEETSEKEYSSIDLYKVENKTTDGSGNGITEITWFDASTHREVTLQDGENPNKKVEVVYDVIGYEGVNRVWDTTTELPADATTQGSGSCYVYYANTPEDQARSLELLKAYNVAFINAEGELLATAVMDTENSYAEAGRVTVPLVMKVDEKVINLGTDTDGKAIYAITGLEQNTPTRITAIVYLDGSKLTNENVLAAAEIQGQLNIQFGNSSELKAIEDEDLQSKEQRVTATVTPTSFDYAAAGEMKSTITVNVVGDQPQAMTAFFLREISPTQGSREPVMTEWTRDENGAWITEYTFTSPGNYVLRSVQLDGVDYTLSDPPKVEISGFSLSYLRCNQADASNRIKVMTAAGSYNVNVELQFATQDVTKMPKKVQGKFVRTDGVSVNIDFVMDANKVWRGGATFLNSGEYVLENLVLDGNYMRLPEAMQQKATIYLGMQVAVYTESPTEFKYLPDEMTPEMKNLAMKVKIMDNAGNSLPGLTGVELQYSMNGSNVSGMYTTLEWDASIGYYTGSFPTERCGEFTFNRVSVLADGVRNVISSAGVAPVFKIISPNPPAFHQYVKNDYTFVDINDATDVATMSVEVKYSDTAKVYAVIRNTKTNQTHEPILGRRGASYTTDDDIPVMPWIFTIPEENGTQDGVWVIDEIRIWDYYDQDSNWIGYTDGAEKKVENGKLTTGMQIKLNAEETKKKVVETIYVTFDEDQHQELGRAFIKETVVENGVQVEKTVEKRDPFLKTHSVSGVKLTIRDMWFEEVRNVTGIRLTYTYDYNTVGHGYYTSTALAEKGLTPVVVEFDAHEAGKTTYSQSADSAIDLTYAGTYTPNQLVFQVNGTKTVKYGGDGGRTFPTDNQPVFDVYSAKPTVKVTAVSPTDTFTINTHASAASGGGFTEMSGVSNSFTDYYACVYIEHTGTTSLFGLEWHNYKVPSVTLALSGIGTGFTNATMTFDNSGHSSYARTYTFEPTQLNRTEEIGYVNASITEGNPPMYFAGEHTVDKLITVKDGMEFVVDLSNAVTINQPQAPAYIDFAANSTTSVALPSKPSRIVGAISEGSQFQITLPAAQKWTTNDQTNQNGEFEQVGQPVTTNGYTVQDGGCDDDTYTAYTLVTTTYQAVSSETTWTTEHEIIGWKIDNITYKPGETVIITGAKTATAVLRSTESDKTTTTKTAMKQYLDYTEGNSGLTSKPAGSDWSGIDLTDRETDPTYS